MNDCKKGWNIKYFESIFFSPSFIFLFISFNKLFNCSQQGNRALLTLPMNDAN